MVLLVAAIFLKIARMAEPALDAELMRSAQRGDRSAFEQLVRSYWRGVYSYARRVLADEDLAQEVAQDTFVRGWRYRASWRDSAGTVRAWLFAVAANRIRDARRARREDPRRIETSDDFAADGEAGLEAFARGAIRREVALALDALDPDQREVLALKYLSDLSYEEVAAALGLTVSAAKMRALRARDELARRLRRLVRDSESGDA